MGTLSFHVGDYAKRRGSGAATVIGSPVRVSGAFTTSTTAANITDSTAATVTMASGELIEVHASVAMRIRFGGVAATANTGIYIPAGVQKQIECNAAGTVSAIDV